MQGAETILSGVIFLFSSFIPSESSILLQIIKSKSQLAWSQGLGLADDFYSGIKICLSVMVLYIKNMAIWIKIGFFFL